MPSPEAHGGDAVLLARLAAGDERALGIVYDQHADTVQSPEVNRRGSAGWRRRRARVASVAEVSPSISVAAVAWSAPGGGPGGSIPSAPLRSASPIASELGKRAPASSAMERATAWASASGTSGLSS